MEVFTSGPNTGNILVTLLLVTFLLIASSRAKMLDKSGSRAAALLGLVVGGLGHWTWLLILLGFLLSSHKATKWRFDEKRNWGFRNPATVTVVGQTWLPTAQFRV